MSVSNISMSNTSSCKYNEPDSDLEKNVKHFAVMFLCVFGIFSNIFIIVLAVKYTVRKNLHHLIINMAVSDALYLASRMWHNVTEIYHIIPMHNEGVPSDTMCKIQIFFNETFYQVSLITLLVISIERFRATRLTLQRPQPYTLKQRAAVLGICWLIPMSLACYCFYAFKFDAVKKRCFNHHSLEKKAIFSGISASTLTIAIVTILTLSLITVRRLSSLGTTQALLNEEQQAMRKKHTMSAVSMVLVSAFLYACCWFPVTITSLLFVLKSYFPKVFSVDLCFDLNSHNYITTYVLPVVNACFSPFIYIIFLPHFKEPAKRILCCCTETARNQKVPIDEVPLHQTQR